MRGWVRGGESRVQGTVGATSVVMLSHQVVYWSRASRKRKMGLVWDFRARKVRTWWLKMWKAKERNVKRRFSAWGQKFFPLTALSCFCASWTLILLTYQVNAPCPVRLHSNACSRPRLSCHAPLLPPLGGSSSLISAVYESCTSYIGVWFFFPSPSFLSSLLFKQTKTTPTPLFGNICT